MQIILFITNFFKLFFLFVIPNDPRTGTSPWTSDWGIPALTEKIHIMNLEQLKTSKNTN